jgi:hypothetical protein
VKIACLVQEKLETAPSLSDIQILKGIRGGCDEEAVRVMAVSPK